MYTKEKAVTPRKVVVFLISVALPMVIGLVSSVLSGDLKAQYNAMAKPLLAPPDWLFGVMWPVLYLLMGIACYLIIISDESTPRKINALSLYALQLVVNAMWSIVFFRGDMLWGAMIVIVVLDLLVIATMMAFKRISTAAALLLVPYLAWILFASYLNAGFALLN